MGNSHQAKRPKHNISRQKGAELGKNGDDG